MSEGLSPIAIPTSIRHACVYRSGAIVTRSGQTPAGTLRGEFSVEDLPLSLADASVRVSAPPGLSVSGVRVSLALPPAGETPETDSEAGIRSAEEAVARLERELRRVTAAQTRREKIAFSLPAPIEDEPPRAAPAAAWKGVIDWLTEAAGSDVEERLRLNEELTAARENLARLAREREEARRRESARAEKVRKRVTFHLEGSPSEPVTVDLEYRVPGACWVPSYVVRIVPREGRATIGLKALVAQTSGEAWDRIKLSVSTAEPLQANRIPELRSLRIGRRQPPTIEAGYREAPEGLEELFAPIDRERTRRPSLQEPPSPPRAEPPSITGVFHAALDAAPTTVGAPTVVGAPAAKGEGRAAVRPLPPPAVPSMPLPVPAPAPVRAPMPPAAMQPPGAAPATMAGGLVPQRVKEKAAFAARARADKADEDTFSAGAEEFAEAPAMEEPAEPPPGALRPRELDYTSYRLASWGEPSGRRGRLRLSSISDQTAELGLVPADARAVERRLREEGSAVVRPQLPEGARPVHESAGTFDYRYDSEALADIPCDGTLNIVPILTKEAAVRFEMVAVPREKLEAYRTAQMTNPLSVPLLAGPVDIYMGDEFLVRTPLRTVPAGGELSLGLGVEEAVKISRNCFFNESSHGLLGGGLSLVHRVEIEVASRLSTSVQMDVRERVPVLSEKEESIEITGIEANPAWEAFDQGPDHVIRGGKRWLFTLPAGETRKLSYSYTVRIDAKNELLGGNRRES
ncbi:MAG: hypothetical protein DIJKHBIC_02060 [Thermoanaerobaculia bacterium]|nr:hypothetical protein [Thermoanaerobaculia bacterium]